MRPDLDPRRTIQVRIRAIASAETDVGLQREHNEDCYAVLGEYDLFLVADGMGGHQAGDVASKLATDAVASFFRSTAQDDVTWPYQFDANLTEEENRLLTGIRIANRRVFEHSLRARGCQGMGTTLVGALFSRKRGRVYVGHVGDSRCYRIRKGKIEQLTRDHSLLSDYLLAMPHMTEEQQAEVPKNVITRALGIQDQVMVDLVSDDAHVGDVYLLCSDGLSGMLSDEQILEVMLTDDDVSDTCRQLIKKANESGGEDNITAVVIRVEESPVSEDEDEEIVRSALTPPLGLDAVSDQPPESVRS
jgi:PPM family protein phosphatase